MKKYFNYISISLLAIICGITASVLFFEGSREAYLAFSRGEVPFVAFFAGENIDAAQEGQVSGATHEAGLEGEILDDTNSSVQNIPLRTINGIATETLRIPNEGRVIVADLSGMLAYTYESGVLTEIYPLLSKGRPGTAWQTPAGMYTINSKKENHFSTIGEVWMPYSMQFFGNYFIHGWPYETDGTPVPEGYSGGCIRMSDVDAKRLYDFADIGTKVIVVADTPPFTQGVYLDKGRGLSGISSDAYIVADVDSGAIIFEKDAREVMPIASITKLMTALISLDVINQYRTTTVSRSAYGTYGAQGDLSIGESIITGTLLYPLLLESSNDASEVLAEFYGRTEFMKRMNERAQAIGMLHTGYDDPSGLSYDNISTAEDLFRMVQYVDRHKRFIFDMTQLSSYSDSGHVWRSNSRFKDHPWHNGGKNGFTDEAQKTLITLFDVPFEGDERTVAVILLRADDTTADARAIISYIEKNVEFLPDLVIQE